MTLVSNESDWMPWTLVSGAPLYESTWNFRRCKDRDPVYGMGMSESNGARTVADGLRRSGHRQIAWVFLADEPVVGGGASRVYSYDDPRLDRRLWFQFT